MEIQIGEEIYLDVIINLKNFFANIHDTNTHDT